MRSSGRNLALSVVRFMCGDLCSALPNRRDVGEDILERREHLQERL